jgi:hypothetical protein
VVAVSSAKGGVGKSTVAGGLIAFVVLICALFLFFNMMMISIASQVSNVVSDQS